MGSHHKSEPLVSRWTRRRFLITVGTGAATLLTGCGSAGKSLQQAGQSLTNGVTSGNGRKALVYGNPSGTIFEELRTSYQTTVATPDTDPTAYDVLIVSGPNFPGEALKQDVLVQKAIAAGKELYLLSVTGEQKEAVLKGHVLSFTKNDSNAYHIRFTRDTNGRPSVDATDMAVCVTGSKGAMAGRKVALGDGGAVTPVDRAGAALFVQAALGQLPEPMRGIKTRQASTSGDSNGTIPARAQYSRDSQRIIYPEVITPYDTDEGPSDEQLLYLFATHEIVAFKETVADGSGFQAILYTDGFLYAPLLDNHFVTQEEGITLLNEYLIIGYYPVAVEHDVAVSLKSDAPLPPNSLNISQSPNEAVGKSASITDATSFKIATNGVSFDFTSTKTRTLTDWGFTPSLKPNNTVSFLWGQQVPYAWDAHSKPDTLKALPFFALSGFAFHNTVSAETNVTYNGTLEFTGSLTGHFHHYSYQGRNFDPIYDTTRGVLKAPYTLVVDWSRIPDAG